MATRNEKMGPTQYKAEIERLQREGKMVSLDQVVAAIDETRQKYRPRILAARQKESAGSKRERDESRRVK